MNSTGSMLSTNNIGTTIQSSTNELMTFLDSNSLVAKIAFLFFVLFIFVLLIQFSLSLLSWGLSPSDSPHLIDGMIDAKQLLIIPQDPSRSNSKPVYRSIDAREGLEFTWSVWIFVQDLGEEW